MNNIGKTYKKLRLAKGFTLLEAADSVISVGQLSNFENGKSMIHTDSFISVLKNINVTFLEFDLLYNKYNKSKEFSHNVELSDAYLTRNTAKLEFLIKTNKEQIVKSPSSRGLKIKLNSLECLYSTISDRKTTNEIKVNHAVDYLVNVKEFGMFELTVLNNCLTYIDIASLSKILTNITTSNLVNAPFLQSLLVQTMTNAVNLFIQENQFTNADHFLLYLESLELLETALYEKLIIKLSRSLLSIKEGNRDDSNDIKYIIDILKFCENTQTVRIIEDNIDKILGQDKNFS